MIGAGPSGMSVLYWLDQMKKQGLEIPEVVCYEKQSNWGGLWNYTWRTGTDENGEPVHGSMYRYLWSNGPKEALEIPDYTFEDHFGKAIPSFPPREVLFDYLQGRWLKGDLKTWIRFQNVVRSVRYNDKTDDFTVVTEDLVKKAVMPEEKFDFVLVGSGHYSVPNVPSFPGIDRFPGRVMHSHDFRDACEFTGKRLLVVGSSYSAEDIAMQCVKYGSGDVICSYRTNPMGFKWPKKITERPLLTHIEGKTIHFKDGSSAEVDAIIMCTGYLHHYPYMHDSLRLRSPNVLYPPNLYKGTVYTEGGNNKVLYIGAQDQYYTYTMFDVQAHWAVQYILGNIKLPDRTAMVTDWKQWVKRNQELKDCHEEIDFQTDFTMDLAKTSGFKYDLDVASIFHSWEHDKHNNILTYRDVSFASKFTKTQSPIHHSTFMTAMDDSMKCFLNAKK